MLRDGTEFPNIKIINIGIRPVYQSVRRLNQNLRKQNQKCTITDYFFIQAIYLSRQTEGKRMKLYLFDIGKYQNHASESKVEALISMNDI